MTKKKIFVSYDYDNDHNYRNLLVAWEANSQLEFRFSDQSGDVYIDSKNAEAIKTAVSAKIKEASYFLCLVGKRTYASKWVQWEISKAVELKKKIIAVKIDSKDKTPEWLINIGVTWAISFTFDAIRKAFENYVFISYSREDSAFVDRLKLDLRQAGLNVWLDTEQIRAGESWQKTIESALSESSAYIFIASASSTSHITGFVLHELDKIIERNTRGGSTTGNVIPIIIDDVGKNNLPAFLQQFQWIDFRKSYNDALARLLETLPAEIRQPAPVQSKISETKGYVFISHSDEDNDFVENLKQFLAEKSYAYWDYQESDRNYHTQLFLELEDAITNAVAVLSVITPAWKRSKWTVKEYFFSEEVGKPVFLLLVKQTGPTLAIAGLPYIDFVSDINEGFERLSKALVKKGL